MSREDDLEQTFSDICVLYELSLAVGESLSLDRNCERFITTLMARKGFTYGAVWLKASVLSERSPPSAEDELVLVYGAPRAQVRERHVDLNHAMWQLANARGSVSVLCDETESRRLVTELGAVQGSMSLFSLGSFGVLKLYARNATRALDPVELSQLETVVRKFAGALEGCLAHASAIHEIAERERAERERSVVQEQLLQAQKMEAVGRLAGGIAHDFNNLLVAVLGNAELLLEDFRGNPQLRESLDAIATAANRAAKLTGQLLAFSRKGPVESTSVNVDSLVHEVQTLLTRTLDPRIRIATSLGLSDVCVWGDASQLHTVLLNLALNARDAMPKGGVLTFETSLTSRPTGIEAAPGAGFEQWIELRVKDTGLGMTPAVAARVFEPFFTTKELGQGTGLGLAAVYGIVTGHGGEVRVEGQPGQGTVFAVRLPGVIARPSAADQRALPLAKGHGIVLLVDDNTNTRLTIAHMLERLGYGVVQAQNGREALDLLATRAEFRVVLLDLRMPVLGGVDTLAQLRKLAPGLPVIAISGFADDQDLAILPSLGVSQVLDKPFSLQALSAALASCPKSTSG
ncbi:MAG: response regulator [Pseudomonadota bacterium]